MRTMPLALLLMVLISPRTFGQEPHGERIQGCGNFRVQRRWMGRHLADHRVQQADHVRGLTWESAAAAHVALWRRLRHSYGGLRRRTFQGRH